jgi:hypothetical protein
MSANSRNEMPESGEKTSKEKLWEGKQNGDVLDPKHL